MAEEKNRPAPDLVISYDCCDVWWDTLTVEQKRYIHWYFRDIERVIVRLGDHYSVTKHQWALEN